MNIDFKINLVEIKKLNDPKYDFLNKEVLDFNGIIK